MTQTQTLTEPQAAKLIVAERRVVSAKRELERLEAERDELRGKYAIRVPVGADWITKAGGKWRRRSVNQADRFKLKDYRAKHKITAAMAAFITPGAPRTQWDFDDLETPEA